MKCFWLPNIYYILIKLRLRAQYFAMAQLLSAKELRSLKNAFCLFDKDHDGKITTKEIDEVLKFLGKAPADYDYKDMIKDSDMYGNGTINFPDFLQIMSQQPQGLKLNEVEINDIFRVFDEDGDGFITGDEIKHVMNTYGDILTEEQINKMMSEADINGNGKIDYEEFAKMMQVKQ